MHGITSPHMMASLRYLAYLWGVAKFSLLAFVHVFHVFFVNTLLSGINKPNATPAQHSFTTDDKNASGIFGHFKI